jgi:hypothetical protein
MARCGVSLGVGAAFLLGVACAQNSQAGDASCPCLTEKVANDSNKTALFGEISRRLVSAGYGGAEGLHGCASYPNISVFDNSTARWCFVDPKSCAVDEEACIKAGGQLGSYLYPEPCRTLEMSGSRLIQDAFVSFATCGNLNPRKNPTVALRNRTFKVFIDAKPYEERSQTIQNEARKLNGLTSAGVELWLDVIDGRRIDTVPFLLRNATPLLSQQAKAIISKSSSTRVAYEVGVGKFDLLIGNLYVTPGYTPSDDPTVPSRNGSLRKCVPDAQGRMRKSGPR